MPGASPAFVLDWDRDAMARATTSRSGDRVAIAHIAERAGCPVEVVPTAINRPLTRGRSAVELVVLRLVHSETEVMSWNRNTKVIEARGACPNT